MKARLVAASAVVVATLASAAAAAPAERVTMLARPTVLGPDEPVMLFGSVDSSQAQEIVTIQAKDCGQRFFRGVAAARTLEGGGWSREYWTGITTTLRAVWNDAASTQITVRRRPLVWLDKGSRGHFQVGVTAQANFWRKRVVFQRFNRRLGTWVAVRSLVLTDTGSGGPYISSSTNFRTSLPKGTTVRAVFPLSQARPCYLAGYSKLVRM